MAGTPRPNQWFREELLKNQQRINHTLIVEEEGQNPIKAGGKRFKRFHIPADIQLCLLHQRATGFGFDVVLNAVECPCCCQCTKQQLKFTEASERVIYRINEPVGFYFTFLKMMMLALLFIILIPGIYSILTIFHNCRGNTTNCDYIYGIPFPRLSTFYTTISLLLNSLTILLIYILIAFLFYWNVLIHQKIYCSNKQASDEHCMLSGYDSAVIAEEYFLEYFREYQMQEVLYTFKIKGMIQLLSKRNRYEALKHKYFREGKEGKIHRMTHKIKKIDKKLIPIKNMFELGQEKQLRTDKIFLRFKNKECKARFDQDYKQGMMERVWGTLCSKSKIDVNNCQLFVQKLGDPRQIIWQNLEISSFKRYIYIFINNISMIVLLGISFVLVLRLTIFEEQYKAAADVILSVAFSFVIEIINLVLAFYIDFTTDLQGRFTVTGQTQSKIIKKIIVYFLNTTLIPFSLLIIQSYRPQETEEDIVRNILTLFIILNIFSPLVSQFLQIPNLLKLFHRRRIQTLGKESLKTQMDANNAFEKFDFNLQDRYSLICERLGMCFFYAGIFPVGALVTVVGLILTYFVGKIMLVRYCSIPKISFRLGILITRIAALFPLIYSLGFVLNLYTYNKQIPANSLYSIILLMLTVPLSAIFIFKGHQIARKFIKPADLKQTTLNLTTYVSYKELNPATFFMGEVQGKSDSKSSKIVANVINFTAFRDAMNVWKFNKPRVNQQVSQWQKEIGDQE